jgi:hypothetical protein
MGSYSAIGVGGLQTHIERLAEPLYQRPNNRTVSSIFEKKIQIKKVVHNYVVERGWSGANEHYTAKRIVI